MSAASTSSGEVAPGATSNPPKVNSAAAELLPATDTLWREVYHVTGPLADAGTWRAVRTDTAEEVMLRVLPGREDNARAQAWDRLCLGRLPNVLKAREAHTIADTRVEVYDAVRGVPLDAWRAARTSVDIATVESITRQLAAALSALHTNGLVHLGLRAGAIFVQEDDKGVHCTLAGLDNATLFDTTELVPAPVDPLYAPPEAVTLQFHEPGPGLCAWDWWSLGRVAQELVLGHHVLDDLPATDATQPAPPRAARAEALLLERQANGPRAGAVEVMGSLDPRLDVLLRGLLTSARSARWGSEFVDRWLQQQPVSHHYDAPLALEKFPWRGRPRTVAEVARELRTAESWSEAAAHIFDADTPGTLADFIRRSSEQKQAALNLGEMLKLAEEEPLRSQPPAVTREIVLPLALMSLAGEKFIWRGRRLDGESVRSLLAEDADNPERLAFVRTLIDVNVASHIDRYDFEAGRSLAEIGRAASEAEAIIEQHGWLASPTAEDRVKIFRLTLELESNLLAARNRLKTSFANSRQPEVEKFFKQARPSRAELVALAWVEPKAAECGFVTHAEWAQQELLGLRERGSQLANALFWTRLARALQAGPLFFGPGRKLAAVWGAAIALLAWLWPGPGGLAAIAGLIGTVALARAAFFIGTTTAVKRFVPTAPRWGWNDGIPRCLAEWETARQGRDAPAIESALREINASIGRLAPLVAAPAPVAEPPKFGGFRGTALASWLVLGVVIASLGWRIKVHPPALPWPNSAEKAALAAAATAKAAEVEREAAAAAAVAESLKLSWPHRLRSDPEVPIVKSTLPATSAQIRYAKARGRKLFAPYRRDTIETLAIFDVPAGDEIGVMMFDGKRGVPVNDRVYILTQPPPTRTWLALDNRPGIYLAD